MRLLSLLIVCLFSTTLWAEEVEFRASAPSVVEVGERFRLSFSINKEGENLQIPEITGFSVMGPSTSQSSSYQIINGKATSSVSFTYTYILTALQEGKYVIPSATIQVDGKSFESNSITIQVIKGSSSTTPGTGGVQGGASRPQDSRTSNENITNENLFLKVDVNRSQLYIGESLEATIKIYSKVDLTNFGRSKFPSFEGFLSEEIPTGERIELVREEYNGQIYNVGIIRKLLLYPQHTGKLTIAPFELECMVRQRIAGGGQSIFDDFFGNYREVRVLRESKPVTIQVKELPQSGKPLGFSGFVGTLTMNSSISSDSVKANDALTFKLIFKGTGNLKLLSAPKLNLPADFEAYEPKINQQIQVGASGMSGTVTMEYLIIPRYAGDYQLPAVPFSYFDTRSSSYKTIQSNSYEVKVAKGTGLTGGATHSGSAVQSFKKEDIRTVGEDIRYIKTGDLKLHRKGIGYFGKPIYWLAFLIPFVLFVVGIILNRRRIRANADIARMKNKTANKMAQRRMKSAAKALKDNNKEHFYEEVLKALWGYMSYKLNIDMADLKRDNINEILSQRGVDDSSIKEFIEVLDETEYARYAPGANSGNEMSKIYRDSIDVITKMDKLIK